MEEEYAGQVVQVSVETEQMLFHCWEIEILRPSELIRNLISTPQPQRLGNIEIPENP